MHVHKRLDYLDVFRGFALLTMVVWHIFNVLAAADIYTDPPYFVPAFSMPTPFPPPLLFTFVSGMGVLLLTRRWLQRDEKGAARKAFWRYGKYVLISLPFTAVFFSPLTYVRWEEALQGIGLTAIFVALIMLYLRPGVKGLACWIVAAAVLESLLLQVVAAAGIANYPLVPTGLADLPAAFLFNALLGGWFSVANLLPMALGGVMMLKLLEGRRSKDAFWLGTAFVAASFALHVAGVPISYYGRSFSFALFSVGEPMLLLSAVYAAYECLGWRFLGFMSVIGRESLLVYVGHFALVVKPIEWFWNPALPDPVAAALTVPLVVLVYAGTWAYAKRKDNRKIAVEKEKMAI